MSISSMVCLIIGHRWEYLWERNIRICEDCDKIEKLI